MTAPLAARSLASSEFCSESAAALVEASLKFDDLLADVTALLQRQGRVSYRALKRRYELSDEDIEDVKAELIDARRVASHPKGGSLERLTCTRQRRLLFGSRHERLESP